MDIFNLSYKDDNRKVYFLSIHIQGKIGERELFVKFIWNKDKKPQNFWDKENQKSLDITNIDHLSFHKNGRVLLTYNNPKKTHFYEKQLLFSLEQLPENSYVPLIIFSVNNPKKHIKYIGRQNIFDIGNNVADLTWNTKKLPFSITCFMVRDNFESKVLESKFPKIFDFDDCAFFPYALNKNIGLFFAFSKRLVLPKDKGYINPKYLKQNLTFDKFPVIGMSIISSDNRILRLYNYKD